MDSPVRRVRRSAGPVGSAGRTTAASRSDALRRTARRPAARATQRHRTVRAEEAGDLFRQGVLRVARATGEAERERLAEAIARLDTATG